jgi:hypothetical protein
MGAGLIFYLTHPSICYYTNCLSVLGSSVERAPSVFPFLNPRVPDFVLGLAIGLSLALAWHWVAWAVH